MFDVKGRTQEGFDSETDGGVALAPGEVCKVLNIIVGHSVDNLKAIPMS